MPGTIDTQQISVDPRTFQSGFASYINELHARNAHFINTHSSTPTNYEYNIANLMNLQFDAIRRNDNAAAKRFQILIFSM